MVVVGPGRWLSGQSLAALVGHIPRAQKSGAVALPKLSLHILDEMGHCTSFAFLDVGDMHVAVFKQEKNKKTTTTKISHFYYSTSKSYTIWWILQKGQGMTLLMLSKFSSDIRILDFEVKQHKLNWPNSWYHMERCPGLGAMLSWSLPRLWQLLCATGRAENAGVKGNKAIFKF